MKNKTNRSWIAILLTIALGIISSTIYDWLKSKPILSSLISLFKTSWKFLIQLLESDLKLWWIILSVLIYKLIKFIINRYSNRKTPKAPEYSNYRSERFTNWFWKWDWAWDPNLKEWYISNLKPYCPPCDIGLLNKSTILVQRQVCPKCQNQYSEKNQNIDDFEGIKSIIYDNVAKNNYSNYIQP